MWVKPKLCTTSVISSKTQCAVFSRSPNGARRAVAFSRALLSRSMPITVRFSKRVRRASVWPPKPRVASTITGCADDAIEGARSSTQRSRITDMCCIFSPILNSFFPLLIDTRLVERSSLVTAGRRIYFESDAGEGTSLPA